MSTCLKFTVIEGANLSIQKSMRSFRRGTKKFPFKISPSMPSHIRSTNWEPRHPKCRNSNESLTLMQEADSMSNLTQAWSSFLLHLFFHLGLKPAGLIVSTDGLDMTDNVLNIHHHDVLYQLLPDLSRPYTPNIDVPTNCQCQRTNPKKEG